MTYYGYREFEELEEIDDVLTILGDRWNSGDTKGHR